VMFVETSVKYRHLTRLIAREDYITFILRESTNNYKIYSRWMRWEYIVISFNG